MSTGTSNSQEAQGSRPSDLRQANCRVLLRLLQTRTACSRAELARLSGLSAPTVASAVQDLERVGLVETVGEGRSSGGRPPGMIRFNASHGYIGGADIGGTRLRMMLADLNGNPVAQWKAKLAPDQKEPRSVCKLIHEGLQTMCKDAGVSRERVLHMTIGAPGITDVDRGVVLSAPNLTNWSDVPLRELIESETGVPAMAENDTNLAALGEHWQGSAQAVDNFVFIAMGTGVGAGIFLGGKVHHGSAWSAGEIGYLGVPGMAREPLQMQRTGQLEGIIGGAGIERQWCEQLARSGRDDASLKSLRGAQIFDLAEKRDPDAISVMRYTAAVLADAISTISLLYDPSLVVLGGGVGSHECLRKETEDLLLKSDFPHPAIRISLLGTQAQLYGAVSISLSAIESTMVC
jgi:glucokinase